MKFLRLILGFVSPVLAPACSALAAIWRWLLADWRNGPLTVLAAIVTIYVFFITPGLRSDKAGLEAALQAEQIAHQQTVANYRAAAAEAELAAQENVARVTAEQQNINEERSRVFEQRIAGARARAAGLERVYDSVRSGTGQGRAEPADMSGPGIAPSDPAETSGEDRFPPYCPAVSATGELSLSDALIATEQAIQLDELITAVIALSQVPTTPDNRKPSQMSDEEINP